MSETELTEAAKQLRALRAQRAELQAARETLEADALEAAALEREQRALADEQALGRLVAEHGAIGVKLQTVETDRGLVVVQRPHALKWRRFQDRGSFTVDDVTALVRPCVVHPSLAEFDLLLDELPATLSRIASAVVELAGHRTTEVSKKS